MSNSVEGAPCKPLCCFLIAGEASGDNLGAALIGALREIVACDVVGIGGPAMEAAGLKSHFPMSDIAVMGLIPVIKRLPLLIRRIREAAHAVIVANPDVLVLIDAPDFTHRVAKRVRKAAPHIPIVDYVSPTVWAWRPGRARKMRGYIDHLMAILPFEPAEHLRLGGPPTSYVGHPITERLSVLRPDMTEATARRPEAPVVLLLPGSRGAEMRALMPVFKDAVLKLRNARPNARFLLPAVPHLAGQLRALVANWSVPVEIVEGEGAKLAAFRAARVALAASGTVSLELAMAQIPMVIGYRVSRLEEWIVRQLVLVSTVVLPNLILNRHVVPEFLQEDCNPETLVRHLLPLLDDGPARNAQLEAFSEVERLMMVPLGRPASEAARIVLNAAQLKGDLVKAPIKR